MTTEDGDEVRRPPGTGEPLPASGDAYIDRAKLVYYALDRGHPVGKHKAAVFRLALGIERDDWEYLRDSIVEQLPRRSVTLVRDPASEHESYTWEVPVPIRGLGAQADRRLLVITAWEMVDGRPELVTLRVAPKNRREARDSG